MKDFLNFMYYLLIMATMATLIAFVLSSDIHIFIIKLVICLYIIFGGLFLILSPETTKENSSPIKLIIPVTEEEYNYIFKKENLLESYYMNCNIFSISKNIRKDLAKSIYPTESNLYIKYSSVIVKVAITYSSLENLLKEVEEIYKKLSKIKGFEKPNNMDKKDFFVSCLSIYIYRDNNNFNQLAIKVVSNVGE